jgi:hypothetical protein
MHGKRSLEGTFLGGCVFSGRIAARAIAGEEAPTVPPARPAYGGGQASPNGGSAATATRA